MISAIAHHAAPLSRAFVKAADFILALRGWRRFLSAFLAGVATALAMAPIYAVPLLFIGFPVLILLLDRSAQTPSPKKSAFVIGWLFGLGYFLAGLYWMAFSFLVQADQFAWMAPFAMLGLPSFLAFFSALVAITYVTITRDDGGRVLVFAALWAIAEYFRGTIFTGLPWNLVGQSFAGSALMAQFAAWGGAYGLSLAVVVAACAPAACLGFKAPKNKALLGSLASLMIIAGLAIFGAIRLAMPEPALREKTYVRIVQPNIPQREKIDPDFWGQNFYKQVELSKKAAPEEAQLFIIWPENGAPLLNEAKSALAALTRELPADAILFAGAVRRDETPEGRLQYFNSMMVIANTPQGRDVVTSYDKHHLVPFGEYLPFYGLLEILGLAQLTPYGDAGFTSGKGPAVLSAGGQSFAPLICYEAIFPGALYPKSERPDWLVTITNDAWFGDTSGPRQHLDMARLRAIESGLPMARSANTGISALIDAKGRIVARVDLYQNGSIDAPLPGALPPTIYDRFGNLLFFIGFFAIGGAGLWKKARKYRKKY